MKTVQLRIKLSEVQYNHFHSLLEQEGCKSVAEPFRKIAFTRHPQGTCKAPTGHPQEEKNEEREKSPHTPLKRKKQEKKNLSTRARVRVREILPAIDLPEWLKLGQNGTLPKNARKRLFEQSMVSIDRPDENGDLYDYGDCNRAARRMFRDLDAEYREKVIEPYRKYRRELRFKAALYRLRNHPELQTTLRAIRLYKKKEKIFSALKIKGETYEKRLFRVREILKMSTYIGGHVIPVSRLACSAACHSWHAPRT